MMNYCISNKIKDRTNFKSIIQSFYNRIKSIYKLPFRKREKWDQTYKFEKSKLLNKR